MARAMKDSGIEWIGQIPSDWKMERLKWILAERKEKNDPQKTDFILSLGAAYGVIPYSEKEGGGNKAKESLTDYRLAYPNDIVMNSMNIISGSVGISKYFGCVSPVYYMLYPHNPENSSEYYCYMFQTTAFQRSLLGLGNGILMKESASGNFNTVRMRIPMEKLGVQLLPIPSSDEQQKIAVFLNRECARIDAVIEKTRASIEEYKKLKQSVITRAVTKGIRPDRKMKDSGIEWIGEIAEDFRLKKLKYVCEILDQYRSPITADQRNQDAEVLYDYYGASGAIDKIDGYTIDDHVMLIGEDGANLRMRNLPLMYEVNGKAWINNHAHILKPQRGMEFYYLFFTLEALDINPYITGSAQPKLSQDNLKNIWLPAPPLSEQKEIAEFIKEKISKIDELIAKKRNYLAELESYKKSLIFEYVTGKKEVAEVV